MLFTPDNAQKVMAGRKTQTRRLIQETDTSRLDDDGEIFQVKTLPHALDAKSKLKWQVGKTYAVQPGRGKSAIGRVKLLSIRQQRVIEISEEDAKAEGVEPDIDTIPFYGEYKDPFRRLWNSIYSGRMTFDTGPMVWALEFELQKG